MILGGYKEENAKRKERQAAGTVPGVHVRSVNVVGAKSHCFELCLVEDHELRHANTAIIVICKHRHPCDLQTSPSIHVFCKHRHHRDLHNVGLVTSDPVLIQYFISAKC